MNCCDNCGLEKDHSNACELLPGVERLTQQQILCSNCQVRDAA
jgi:hypothetical protein